MPPSEPESSFDRSEAPSFEKAWTETAVDCVNRAVSSLVDQFMEHPFTHRVEHSLHVQMFSLLMAEEHLAGYHPMKSDRYSTQLVQKEWPGSVQVVDPDSRRKRYPSYDLAVLTPWSVEAHDFDEFDSGSFEPLIVIEMGLNYDQRHLVGDLEKMRDNNVTYPYFVHFTRRRSGKSQAVEDAIHRAESILPGVKTAFVHLDADHRDFRLKRLDEAEIAGPDFVERLRHRRHRWEPPATSS